ncbi:MAG: nuclear transport factor 2 family protein [Candidatus Thorarchaeota archaeon]
MNQSSNREIAISFLELVVAGQVEEAYDKYVSQDLIHHNPYFEGTREALLKAMYADSKEHPDKSMEIKMSFQEVDLVTTFSHIKHTPESLGFAAVHIFRIENGKIIEMWDVVHVITDNSPNEHGVF